MKIILLSIILLALAFAGIAVKILLKKDGKFAGTCSSNNPLLQKEGAVCGICGASPDEQCKKERPPPVHLNRGGELPRGTSTY